MSSNWSRWYHAQVVETLTIWGIVPHLIIERYDGKPVKCQWDTLQEIKNFMLGEDVQAIEVFPAQTDVVNEVNRRHLWALPPGAVPRNMLAKRY